MRFSNNESTKKSIVYMYCYIILLISSFIIQTMRIDAFPKHKFNIWAVPHLKFSLKNFRWGQAIRYKSSLVPRCGLSASILSAGE